MSGTARGSNGSPPAWPQIMIAALSTGNPLLLVDEIDKAGGSSQYGHIHHTLLAMTEPSTARAWFNSCLLAPADLSAVSWVFCGNDLSSVPRPLRSRLEIIEMSAPSAKWSWHIVERIAAELVVQMGLLPRAAGLLLASGNVLHVAVAVHRRGGTLRDIRRLLRAALADHVGGIRRRLDH